MVFVAPMEVEARWDVKQGARYSPVLPICVTCLVFSVAARLGLAPHQFVTYRIALLLFSRMKPWTFFAPDRGSDGDVVQHLVEQREVAGLVARGGTKAPSATANLALRADIRLRFQLLNVRIEACPSPVFPRSTNPAPSGSCVAPGNAAASDERRDQVVGEDPRCASEH